MPLTNAEKNRNYLDRLKENGQYEAYKKKKSAAEKRRRDRIKLGLEQLPKAIREKTKRLNREHSRKRVFEYRQRKRGMVTEMTSNASPMTASNKPAEGYKTASARSKAFAKMRRAMPSAIGLQKELMSKMLRTFNAEDQMDIIQGISLKAKPSRGTSQSVIEMVQSFYERDNISRMSLNTKDCCQCVNLSTGIKEVKQIRHLLYKLDDVYDMFVKYVQNGDETKEPPVKSTTFFNLRPKYVKLVGSTPLDTSFCSYHSNFIIPEDMKTECHINGVQGIHQDTCVDKLDRLKHGERDTNLVNCDYRGNATPSTPSTASTIVRQNSLPKEFTAMIQTKTEPMDSFDCET